MIYPPLFAKRAGTAVELPLVVVGALATSAGGRLGNPGVLGAEQKPALQVLDEQRGQPFASLQVPLVSGLENAVAVGGLEQDTLYLVAPVRGDGAGHLTVAPGLLGDAVAVGLDGNERVIRKAGDDVAAEGHGDEMRVVSLSHISSSLLTGYRSGCP